MEWVSGVGTFGGVREVSRVSQPGCVDGIGWMSEVGTFGGVREVSRVSQAGCVDGI